jgi:hypothetical protein
MKKLIFLFLISTSIHTFNMTIEDQKKEYREYVKVFNVSWVPSDLAELYFGELSERLYAFGFLFGHAGDYAAKMRKTNDPIAKFIDRLSRMYVASAYEYRKLSLSNDEIGNECAVAFNYCMYNPIARKFIMTGKGPSVEEISFEQWEEKWKALKTKLIETIPSANAC